MVTFYCFILDDNLYNYGNTVYIYIIINYNILPRSKESKQFNYARFPSANSKVSIFSFYNFDKECYQTICVGMLSCEWSIIISILFSPCTFT